MGVDIGNITHPMGIRLFRIKLPVEQIRRNKSWLTCIRVIRVVMIVVSSVWIDF
jgi:hypothetical protein